MDGLTPVLLVVVAAGLLMVFSGARSREQARINARLAAIERKIDAVTAHLGIVEPPVSHPDVLEHLRQGRRINAIKAYRDATGASLAEARDAVERLAREQRLQ